MRLVSDAVYVMNENEKFVPLRPEDIKKYRLKFEKNQKLIYIGHLDLLKLFQRSVKRGKLPIEYSKGFNPHQLMVFAIPLPLGMESGAEYIDIRLTEDVPPETIVSSLNAVFPQGIRILEARKISFSQNCAADVHSADYTVILPHTGFEDIIEEINKSESIQIERTVKKKVKQTEIRPYIKKLSIEGNTLKTTLVTGSQGNLKPDDLLKYIYKCKGLEYIPYKVKIKREEMYADTEGSVKL